jgi:hypothetical protein
VGVRELLLSREPANLYSHFAVTFDAPQGLKNMAKTAAEVIVDMLIDWGVDTIFGLPGDGINGIVEALRKSKDKIRFIQVRHEEVRCGMKKSLHSWLAAMRSSRTVSASASPHPAPAVFIS